MNRGPQASDRSLHMLLQFLSQAVCTASIESGNGGVVVFHPHPPVWFSSRPPLGSLQGRLCRGMSRTSMTRVISLSAYLAKYCQAKLGAGYYDDLAGFLCCPIRQPLRRCCHLLVLKGLLRRPTSHPPHATTISTHHVETSRSLTFKLHYIIP